MAGDDFTNGTSRGAGSAEGNPPSSTASIGDGARSDRADAISAPQWNSDDLLRGEREALIVHGDEVYRLRCTRNGKLILHK